VTFCWSMLELMWHARRLHVVGLKVLFRVSIGFALMSALMAYQFVTDLWECPRWRVELAPHHVELVDMCILHTEVEGWFDEITILLSQPNEGGFVSMLFSIYTIYFVTCVPSNHHRTT